MRQTASARAHAHGDTAVPFPEGRLLDVRIPDARLTPAEHEVLCLVARGLDNRATSAEPGKSEKTVRNQVSSILDKLGLRTRAEAIVHARERAG